MKLLAHSLAACTLLLLLPAQSRAESGSISVIMLLDSSGCLHGLDLSKTRTLPGALMRNLPPGSVVEVVTFATSAEVVAKRTSSSDDLDHSLQNFEFKTDRAPANLAKALREAVKQLRSERDLSPFILCITDGHQRSATDLDAAASGAKFAHIPIFTVAVGGGDSTLLKNLAEQTGGTHFTFEEASAPALAYSMRATLMPQARTYHAPLSPTHSIWSRPWLSALVLLLFLCGLLLPAVRFLKYRRSSPHDASKRLITTVTVSGTPKENSAEAVVPAFVGPVVPPQGLATQIASHKLLVIDCALTIVSGKGEGNVFILDHQARTFIGSACSAHVRIDDPLVAARHCSIVPSHGVFSLITNGTTEETYVNGERIDSVDLHDGDKIRIAKTILSFSLSTSAVH